jgi:hypothetical protein
MKTPVEQIFEMIENQRVDDLKQAKEFFITEEKKKIENAFKRGYIERDKVGKFRNSLEWYAEDYYNRIFFKNIQ